MKKEVDAFKKMNKSVDINRKSNQWKYVVEGLETLAKWLDEKGRKKEAEENRSEAQKIRKDHGLS